MEKDIRIKKAEQSVASAKAKVFAAQKEVDEEYEKLSAAYTEVFEEIVCKRGERLFDKEFSINGYFDKILCGGSSSIPTLIYFPVKKDGTPSLRKEHAYCVDKLLCKYSKKQQ